MEDEKELVIKAGNHDREAFSQLMILYGTCMYKVARAILKNEEDVADAMQETALTCWEKIGTLQKEQFFKTWLIRILINHCNGIRRKKSRYILDYLLQETAVTEEAYANAEWMELLTCLGEKYRVVMVLYYMEGFRIRDIASMLSISESAVKERLSVARKKMERYYTRECMKNHAGVLQAPSTQQISRM